MNEKSEIQTDLIAIIGDGSGKDKETTAINKQEGWLAGWWFQY